MKIPNFLYNFKAFSFYNKNFNNNKSTIPKSSPLEKFVPEEEEEEKTKEDSSKRYRAFESQSESDNSDQKKNKKLKRNTIKLVL